MESCVFDLGNILVVALSCLDDILAVLILGKSQVANSHLEGLMADLLDGISDAVEPSSCCTNPVNRRHHRLHKRLSVGGVDTADEFNILFTSRQAAE